MSSIPVGAVKAIEVMINNALTRLNTLEGDDRRALFDEFKEWLENIDNDCLDDGVLYCNWLNE
tara:strand:+ start:327 stop:515 length:189 start_codon:yes stop_codon:yes gene_type:complete